jgi:hypothetical protein
VDPDSTGPLEPLRRGAATVLREGVLRDDRIRVLVRANRQCVKEQCQTLLGLDGYVTTGAFTQLCLIWGKGWV